MKSYISWSVWRPTSQKPLDINWCFKNAKHVPLSNHDPPTPKKCPLETLFRSLVSKRAAMLDNRLKPYIFRRLFFTSFDSCKIVSLVCKIFYRYIFSEYQETKFTKPSSLTCFAGWLTKYRLSFTCIYVYYSIPQKYLLRPIKAQKSVHLFEIWCR